MFCVFKAWVRDHGVVFSSRLPNWTCFLLEGNAGKMLPCLDLSLWRDFLIAYVLVPFVDPLLFVYYHLGKWVGAVVSYIPWVGVRYKRG